MRFTPNRITEQIPVGPDGMPIVKARREGNGDSFDELGDKTVGKVPGQPQLRKLSPAERKTLRDEVKNAMRDNSDNLDPASEYDWQPIRDLLAKHGKAYAAICGPEVVDEMTALAGAAEPVQESWRRGTRQSFEELPLVRRKYSHDESVVPLT